MRFGKAVVKYRYLIFVVSILLLIPSVIGYLKTDVNYDMLTYLPKDMETMKGQDLLLKDFGKGGFTLIVTENMTTEQVRNVASDVKKVDHVAAVVNLNDILDPSIPKEALPDTIRENFKKDNASMIAVFFDRPTSNAGSLKAITQIRKVMTKNCYASGMTALVQDLKNLCIEEEPKYVGIAVLVVVIAMMLLLDSFLAPILFLIGIGMAIIYNLGSNIFFGEISFVTKAIAAVLQLAVTMDYSIFLWHSYEEKREIHSDDHKAAMAEAINDTLVAIAGSSITTVAGFIALCFMSYTMGRDLGLVMAKGVLLGLLTSVTILPTLILLFDKPLNATRHKSLLPNMDKLAHKLTSRYVIYIVIFALLLLPAIYGYQHRTISYDMSKMISSEDNDIDPAKVPFYTANTKLSEDFGINTTHIVIAKSSLSDAKGREMSDAIKDVSGVKSVIGVDSLLGNGVPKEALPDEFTDALMSKNHQMIIVNSAYTISTPKCNNQINQIKKIIKSYDKSAMLIGEGPATKDLINLTAKDFRVVSLMSILMVFLIIFFTMRSWTLPIILVAVIEFAIYVNLGITGYTGLVLPFIVPVLISTIQLGSTVDYAILLTTRYKTERGSGKRKREAIEIAASTSIPSILVSALGFFAATFGVSIYSQIGIISTLCVLMARGAIISMLSVILVLPALLMALDPLVCRTTKGLREIIKKEHDEKKAASKAASEA